MNQDQFKLIAECHLRKPAQRLAVFDVLFRGLSHSQAERCHGCSSGSVRNSIKSVNKVYNLHIKLMGEGWLNQMPLNCDAGSDNDVK